VAPEAIRWAIRLSQTTAGFCNQCLGYCLQNMERGLKQRRQDVRPTQWDFVDVWKLRQGTPSKTNLSAAGLRRALAHQQNAYRQALSKLEEFERAFHAGEANLRVFFQVWEGFEMGEQAERWSEKLRRAARCLSIKPNELANRMIAAGIVALEREDPGFEPDFVVEYRQKFVSPKIEQFENEEKLAAHFNAYSDVPQELENDDCAFMRLIEVTNLHYRDLVGGFMERRTMEEVFSKISRDRTLSQTYLDRLKELYASPSYEDWSEPHPLRNKRLKKEIIDAWVADWQKTNRAKPSERYLVAEIISQLAVLSEAGLRAIQREIALALSLRFRKGE
jgi:hypothetical protein